MSSFIKTSWALILIIALCALIQILVGITWWKVIVVSLFLVGVISLQTYYKYRTVGKVLLWVVIVVWGYHIITVEIIENKFSLTNTIKDRSQMHNDYKIAEGINPEMLLSKIALLEVLNHRQDSLATIMSDALYAGKNEEAKRILEEQIKITKEIHLMKESIKVTEKDDKSKSSESNAQVINTQFADETSVGRTSGNETVYFTADDPFKIIVSIDNGAYYVLDDFPAGKSFRHFDNEGKIRVQGAGRKDIKILNRVKDR